MSGTLTTFSPDLADRIRDLVMAAAAQDDVRAAVEANHEDNRWWPTYVHDRRIRMAVAGWTTRVSYAMVDVYADVVKSADAYGWDHLTGMGDDELAALVSPLGLTGTRIRYLRSLMGFLDGRDDALTMPAGDFIQAFADHVTGASYKVAQCAALYSRGYHCGIIPVDSGMITKLAPCLGMTLENGSKAHERMRLLLESYTTVDADICRNLISKYGHEVTVPDRAAPTWWLHLVLIYFKRLYLNRPVSPRLCTLRPTCPDLLDCAHTP